MPTSVLLAVLVAAGLLALAPALVRRYDATERQAVEREWSTARVVHRRRRRRTMPHRRPVNPPRSATAPAPDPAVGSVPVGSVPARSGAPGRTGQARRAHRPGRPARGRPAARRGRRRAFRRRLRRGPVARLLSTRPLLSRPAAELTVEQRRRWWRYHRRRVLLTLVLLLVSELACGAALAPVCFVGAGATVLLTVAYLVHLRNRALAEARRRREEIRRRHEAAHRAAQARARAHRAYLARRRRAAELAAARRAALARELAEAQAAAAAAHAEEDLADGTHGPSYLRGRPYQARAANF